MQSKKKIYGTLYLIPCAIADSTEWKFYPAIEQALRQCSVIVCERIRTTRRQIKYLFDQPAFDALELLEMGKHADNEYIDQTIRALMSGKHAAILSEAGMPCIADPGHTLVLAAHKKNIPVHPFAGPSSFMMALMASGLSGQAFQFHGYLSRDQDKRSQELKQIDRSIKQRRTTHIVMETPYRNQKMLEDITRYIHQETMLSIAAGLSSEQQKITTMPIHAWKKTKNYFDEKLPAVFVLGQHQR